MQQSSTCCFPSTFDALLDLAHHPLSLSQCLRSSSFNDYPPLHQAPVTRIFLLLSDIIILSRILLPNGSSYLQPVDSSTTNPSRQLFFETCSVYKKNIEHFQTFGIKEVQPHRQKINFMAVQCKSATFAKDLQDSEAVFSKKNAKKHVPSTENHLQRGVTTQNTETTIAVIEDPHTGADRSVDSAVASHYARPVECL